MMLNGKLIIDELLIILFVFTLSLFPVEARTTSGNGQKVLVISSYSPIKEEGNHLIASFIDQMQVDSEAKIFVEYMDCEASPVFETWVGWMRQLFAAYKVKPDVVVLLGNEAWSSYRVTCVDSWHEIPVVLGYVKGAFIDYENKDKKLFSVADMMPMKESFGDLRITGYYYKDFDGNLAGYIMSDENINEFLYTQEEFLNHEWEVNKEQAESPLQKCMKRTAGKTAPRERGDRGYERSRWNR